MKSWNYFRNYGHKIGSMGYIDSDKSNPVYLIDSFVKILVGIIQVKWGEIWITIKIEKIVVISHITQELSNQTRRNKQKEKKSNLS